MEHRALLALRIVRFDTVDELYRLAHEDPALYDAMAIRAARDAQPRDPIVVPVPVGGGGRPVKAPERGGGRVLTHAEIVGAFI